MREIYYCYSINPTDFWFGSFNKNQLVRHAIDSINDLDGCIFAEYGEIEHEGEPNLWINGEAEQKALALVEAQMASINEIMDAFANLLKDGGWQNEARYCFVPSEYALRLASMRKIDSNGTTYVVSPVPLDYLLGQHYDYAYVYENGLWRKEP